MPRIPTIDPSRAVGDTAAHLDACRKMLGGTPNLFTTAAHSPAAVGTLVGMFAGLAKSSLGAKTGELVAVAIAQANGCGYCVSAHSAIGSSVGLTPAALVSARRATAADGKTEAILKLALAINQSRGRISDATLAEGRAAGLTDAEIVEIVAHVALNVFTNYLNLVAQTTIDFPVVPLDVAA